MDILDEKVGDLGIIRWGFFKKRSIMIIMAIILVCSSYDKAIAGDTRVVVGVSISTGLVVGAFGLFLHMSYSSEVAVLEGNRQNNNLVLFPEVRPIPSDGFDRTAYPDNIKEEPLKIYFVGIRW